MILVISQIITLICVAVLFFLCMKAYKELKAMSYLYNNEKFERQCSDTELMLLRDRHRVAERSLDDYAERLRRLSYDYAMVTGKTIYDVDGEPVETPANIDETLLDWMGTK